MNVYTTEFFARCPVNGTRIRYSLRIETVERIAVENILLRVEALREGFHETFADDLHAAFGGAQTLRAEHHGVTIETVRSEHRERIYNMAACG